MDHFFGIDLSHQVGWKLNTGVLLLLNLTQQKRCKKMAFLRRLPKKFLSLTKIYGKSKQICKAQCFWLELCFHHEKIQIVNKLLVTWGRFILKNKHALTDTRKVPPKKNLDPSDLGKQAQNLKDVCQNKYQSWEKSRQTDQRRSLLVSYTSPKSPQNISKLCKSIWQI